MAKYSMILAILCVFLLSLSMLRPDRWREVEDKARQDALLFASVAERPDRIGFALIQDETIRHLVLFDVNQIPIYPEKDGFVPVRFTLSETQLRDLMEIYAQTAESQWLRFDRDGQKLLNCRKEDAICLVYDRVALEELFGLRTGALKNPGVFNWLNVVLGVVSMALVAFAAWSKLCQHSVGTDLELVPDRYSARRGDLEIALTPRDLKLLKLLIDRQGSVVTKDELYDVGWGRDFMPNSRALDQHIINLRKKLDPDRKLPRIIETVRGVGYRLST
ncbi:winged helix-turn-helix transcriptional regulator [uncultured Roseobacter sp.]|uniref:winged helix-turn-helix transcriptional regulator n=1 Tax=uncultured Roseobacter sp. TaxID=114847 RepID=UPI00260ACD80|nr:winged helix-turn-helix transcriptional regulator [uncultured Roseobacter sp.]